MEKIYLASQVKFIEQIIQATYLTLDHRTFKNKLADIITLGDSIKLTHIMKLIHITKTYSNAWAHNFHYPFNKKFCDELKKSGLPMGQECVARELAYSSIYDAIYYKYFINYKKIVQSTAEKIKILLAKHKQLLGSASDEDRTKIIKNIQEIKDFFENTNNSNSIKDILNIVLLNKIDI
jgi:hypothetical protein